MTSSARPRPRGRLRVRTVLAIGVLTPMLGLAVVSAAMVSERLHRREAASQLEVEAGVLREVIELRNLFTREAVHATASSVAADLNLPPLVVPGLIEAGITVTRQRAVLDDRLASDASPEIREIQVGLSSIRQAVAAAEATFTDVEEAYGRFSTRIDRRLAAALADVEAAADRAELSASVRQHLRNLRSSTAAYTASDERIAAALGILIGGQGADVALELADENARFAVAVDTVELDANSGAARAWERFFADDSANRVERLLTQAVGVGVGARGAVTAGLLEQGSLIADGIGWGTLLGEVVEAAAEDLADAAAATAAAETEAVAIHVGGAAALAVVAVSIGVATARQITRPADRLRDAAQRVSEGEFDVPALKPSGPVELHATVEAFNDMAGTLAAVEDHAVALAKDIDDPLLDERLPGRTGQAMQVALDRLRQSVEDADEHRAELLELASHDGLTGLLNRTAAMVQIERELARSRRDGTGLLALYVDLDGLKQLNDRHGHATGDDAVRRTAEALAATTRDADIVARIGGDEFLIVGPVPPDGDSGIDAFAHRVHEAVRHRVVELEDGSTVPLDCCVGVAVGCPSITDADQLIKAADVALYDAKASGRGRVSWHRPSACVDG